MRRLPSGNEGNEGCDAVALWDGAVHRDGRYGSTHTYTGTRYRSQLIVLIRNCVFRALFVISPKLFTLPAPRCVCLLIRYTTRESVAIPDEDHSPGVQASAELAGPGERELRRMGRGGGSRPARPAICWKKGARLLKTHITLRHPYGAGRVAWLLTAVCLLWLCCKRNGLKYEDAARVVGCRCCLLSRCFDELEQKERPKH
ncbi:hypothetical protein LZ32DRAFT_406712 [Colletotrichum eremochloae]|nr:hypothetical protein LZ32DRAFT_406712 [Colletotrichum eremochloae]